jgi:proteasome-associated ATPase
MRVAVSPASRRRSGLEIGREVMLNEALNIVAVKGYEKVGEVVLVKEVLDDDRVLVVAHADEERVVPPRRASLHRAEHIRVGDALTARAQVSGFVFERIPKAEVAGPGARGGARHLLRGHRRAWPARSRQIRDAVELPYLHPELFASTSSSRPRASCSTARPGAARP